jgi:hypothetical protein
MLDTVRLMRVRATAKRAFAQQMLLAAVLLPSLPAGSEDTLQEFIAGGKLDLSVRLRYESVGDDAPQPAPNANLRLKDAHALTLRTALGYTTGSLYNFNAYVQIEDVRAADEDAYNDGGRNGVTNRAAVVDPEGTEVNQAFLRFGGVPRTVLTYGRQELTHREAPLHRYLGNVGFRQNMQTYDAFRAVNLALPKTVVDYAYIWNANRIFGEDNPNPELRDLRMHSHVLNVQYSGLEAGKLEAYAYLLDFVGRTSPRFSTATYGLRFQGSHAALPKLRLNYALEAATQSDYASNPNDIDAHYALAEISGRYAIGKLLESIGLGLGYELLSGKGGVNAFQTPLGTNHAFQGAADRFLVTPGDGIRDAYVRLTAKVAGAQLAAEFHDFRADRDNYRYGQEWDLLIEKPIAQRFLIGAQYADYQAARNARNLARNRGSGQVFDLTKFWLYAQFRY